MGPVVILLLGGAAVLLSLVDIYSSGLRWLARGIGCLFIVWYLIIMIVAKISAWQEKRHPKVPCHDPRATEVFFCLEEKIKGIREAHGCHRADGSWHYRLILRDAVVKVCYTAQTKTFLVEPLSIWRLFGRKNAHRIEFVLTENDTVETILKTIIAPIEKILHRK